MNNFKNFIHALRSWAGNMDAISKIKDAKKLMNFQKPYGKSELEQLVT